MQESSLPKRRTGYVFEELMMWHDAGNISFSKWTEPGEIWENPPSKRRLHSLLEVSGITRHLHRLQVRHATIEELIRFHDISYVEKIMNLSKLNGGDAGEQARFFHGGYDIATLSAGSLICAVEAVINNEIDNAYCLVRPPGHHALKDKGMGFCIFNNIVVAALHARTLNKGIHRIAVVDYDVHHGNGTQQAFWNDSDALLICLHQDSNYPLNSGSINEMGGPDALGSIINIPLPPGSGTGAYHYAFEKVVLPALTRFHPDIILVSSGFDAEYMDPLGAMMLSSEAFGQFAALLVDIAETLCSGRIVFTHEGGYSKDYVPYCGLAVIEAMTGIKTEVQDPYLYEVRGWGYQSLQSHQALVIDAVAAVHNFTDSTSSSSYSTDEQVEIIKNSFTTNNKNNEIMTRKEKAIAFAIERILSGMEPESQTLILNSIINSNSLNNKL